jgi:hypothetical protein
MRRPAPGATRDMRGRSWAQTEGPKETSSEREILSDVTALIYIRSIAVVLKLHAKCHSRMPEPDSHASQSHDRSMHTQNKYKVITLTTSDAQHQSNIIAVRPRTEGGIIPRGHRVEAPQTAMHLFLSLLTPCLT